MNVEKLMERQVAEDITGEFGEQELSKRTEVDICEVTELPGSATIAIVCGSRQETQRECGL